jgi:hypothetical protein
MPEEPSLQHIKTSLSAYGDNGGMKAAREDQRQFDVAVTDIEVTYTLASPFNVDHPMRRERSGQDDMWGCSLFPLRSNPTQFQAKARA